MSAEAWIGRELDGRYIIEAVLGVGGMGAVFRARHKFTGSQVAIKMLKPEVQLDPAVQKRFLAEAQAPNRIGHPAIVQVLDAGRTPQGSLYMVMELLIGRTLREALRRHDLSATERARILRDLLDVLVAAHAKAFVHRDLKPDNVFLSAPADTVRLLDFGIAKVLDDAARTANTVTGALLGTPAYMAPEQLADARAVDARADLWAIGVIAYEMISGRLPLRGQNVAELLTLLASGQVTPIRAYVPDASSQLEAFFARALAVDPRQRFDSATEMASALGAALPTGGAPRAHPPTSPPPRPSEPRHHPPTPGPLLPTAASIAAPQQPTAASVAAAPMTAPSVAAPHRRPPAGPQHPRALTSGRSTKLWIALTISLGAIAIVVILLLSRRGGGDKVVTVDAKAAEPTVPDRASDAPAPQPAVDAAPDEPTPPARDAGLTAAIDCARDCQAMAKRCEYGIECEKRCKVNPKARDCLARALAAGDCREGALCGGEVLCGHPIATGRLTCGEALQVSNDDCMKRFGPTCGCKGMTDLDPSWAVIYAQISSCVFNCGAKNAPCLEICGNRYAEKCLARQP